MPGTEFFTRMQPEFEQQTTAAREVAERQTDVERLISTGEYECYQLRRELNGLIELAEPPQSADGETAPAPLEPAEAA